MAITLIICGTLAVLFFSWLYYKAAIDIYVDELVESGPVYGVDSGKVLGTFFRYKRTYKNGKVIYYETKDVVELW